MILDVHTEWMAEHGLHAHDALVAQREDTMREATACNLVANFVRLSRICHVLRIKLFAALHMFF